VQPGGAGEQDERGRHATAGTLDQDPLPRSQVPAGEQHPVGGQVGHGEARGLLEGQRGRLVEEVAARHRDLLGEGAVVALGQDREVAGEGLVLTVGVGDHGVHDDLAPVGGDAGGVAPDDDRHPLLGDADPAQRPHVVVVETGGADLDDLPARRR
jgi:hypothetical protein